MDSTFDLSAPPGTAYQRFPQQGMGEFPNPLEAGTNDLERLSQAGRTRWDETVAGSARLEENLRGSEVRRCDA
jgi:hypothetical protein